MKPLQDAVVFCKSFAKKSYKTSSSSGEDSGGNIRIQVVLEKSLELPLTSCVAGDDFDPCRDAVRDDAADSFQLSFTPRSPLYYPVGSVSESLGLPNWFRVDCFNDRLASMVTFFQLSYRSYI